MTREQLHRKTVKTKDFSSANDRSAYWKGYIRGLRVAYHGKEFETQEEHRKWMALVHDTDEIIREMGRGYRDGLNDK